MDTFVFLRCYMPITQTCETLFLKYFFRLKLEDSGEDDEGSQIDTFRPAPVRLLLTGCISK